MAKGEVAKKFEEDGIADKVLAACKWADKTIEQLAVSLGINRGAASSWSGKERDIEQALDQLIAELDLPIEKHFHGSIRADGERVAGSYYTYGLKRDKPPLFQGRKEPRIETYTIADLQQKEREREMANTKRMQELAAKLDAVLADIENVNPLQLSEIQKRCGAGASFLSGDSNPAKARRKRVDAAISAEAERRANLAAKPEPVEVQPSRKRCEVRPDQEQYIEWLKQQNEQLQRQLREVQQANEELGDQPRLADFSEQLSAMQNEAQNEAESLQRQIEALQKSRDEALSDVKAIARLRRNLLKGAGDGLRLAG